MRHVILHVSAVLLLLFFCSAAHAQEDNDIWWQFVVQLKSGQFTLDQIRPYDPIPKSTIFGFLSTLRQGANWSEWEASPESSRVGNEVHYLIPLTIDGARQTYCFTFLTDAGGWYFEHLESITVRLDKIGPLPASTFPDVSEGQKSWMREEILVSEQVRLFNMLAKDKGRAFAFDWFKDGAGYFMAARAWVPFIPVSRAFVLYLCWEQANLRGSSVTLQKLDEHEAVITLEPHYFKFYSQTEQMREQISADDYRGLFETIWQDRAENAGWNLKIIHKGNTCVLHLTREK